MRLSSVCLFVLLSIFFTSASAAILGARSFRFVQAVPSLTLDVYVNGARVFQNVGYASITNFTTIISTDNFATILVIPSGFEASSNTSIASRFFATEESTGYTIVYRLQFGTSPYLDLLTDSLCSPTRGAINSQLQFFNLDSTLQFSFADVLIRNEEYLFKEVPSSILSELTELKAGNYNLTITGSNLNGPVLQPTLNLQANQRYLLVLFGTFSTPSTLVFQRILSN
eukprot:TRINITY_DN1645_c0_g1_i1.p1 TRINITY_DN1645_c0_g1~~TRINITY_DN1645_c0_g1_i1.p1  ORF type:complete len:227 (+),score=64.70 TRINITY_DN1645_c0_g1_i1:137-817(+)